MSGIAFQARLRQGETSRDVRVLGGEQGHHLRRGRAHLLAAGLVAFAFAVMLFTLLMERRFGRMRP